MEIIRATSPYEVEMNNSQLGFVNIVVEAINTLLKARKRGLRSYTFPEFFKDREKMDMSNFTEEIARATEQRFLGVKWDKAVFDFPGRQIILVGPEKKEGD